MIALPDLSLYISTAIEPAVVSRLERSLLVCLLYHLQRCTATASTAPTARTARTACTAPIVVIAAIAAVVADVASQRVSDFADAARCQDEGGIVFNTLCLCQVGSFTA